jgi:hypothetical protein
VFNIPFIVSKSDSELRIDCCNLENLLMSRTENDSSISKTQSNRDIDGAALFDELKTLCNPLPQC